MELSQEDKEFLKTYKVGDYERPSVTVDMLVFTVVDKDLKLMLIKRKNPPYRNCWAIPGGFVNMDEDIKTAAERELKEETNMDAYLEQFGVFGQPNRDPRTRVISIVYLALVPEVNFTYNMLAGDDAKEAKLFTVKYGNKLEFDEDINLAFDHENIIKEGIEALRLRLQYSDIAFHLVDKNKFTFLDLQNVYEAITGKPFVKSNFRTMIKRSYNLVETGELSRKYQRPAKYYKLEVK